MTLSESDGGTCLRCGYNLTGLDDRRACPECGLLVGLSRKSSDALADSHPRWLMKLIVGVVAVGLSLPSLVLIPIGYAIITEAWDYAQPVYDWKTETWDLAAGESANTVALMAIGAVSIAGPGLFLLLGVWLLTSRRSNVTFETARVEGPRRQVLRGAASVLCLVLIAEALNQTEVIPIFDRLPRIVTQVVLYPVFFMIVGVVVALLSRRLQSLAVQAPAPLLAADSPVVGFVFAGSLWIFSALTLAGMLGVTASPPTTGIGGQIAVVVMAVGGAVALTSVIWSFYLLIRYGLAFAETRSQALALFRESATAEPYTGV
ncbi:MAG: hypothetical protein AAF561_05510 [Planctomycetota bacterium]